MLFKYQKNLLKVLSSHLNINNKDVEGNTFFILLAQKGFLFDGKELYEMVEFLFKLGCDPNIKNNEGDTALAGFLFNVDKRYCDKDIKKFNKKIIKIINLFELNGVDFKSRNNFNLNYAHIACYNLHEDITMYLMDKGIGIEEKTNANNNLLMIACEQQDFTTVYKLTPLMKNINEQNFEGDTALHFLLENVFEECERDFEANKELLDCAIFLLNNGASIEIRNDKGMTALNSATITSHKVELEQYMLKDIFKKIDNNFKRQKL